MIYPGAHIPWYHYINHDSCRASMPLPRCFGQVGVAPEILRALSPFSLFHFYKHRECLDSISISIRLPSFEIVSLKNIPLSFSFITFKHLKRIHLILVFQFQSKFFEIYSQKIFCKDESTTKNPYPCSFIPRRFTHKVPSIVTRVKWQGLKLKFTVGDNWERCSSADSGGHISRWRQNRRIRALGWVDVR